jgi:hypothetical protein
VGNASRAGATYGETLIRDILALECTAPSSAVIPAAGRGSVKFTARTNQSLSRPDGRAATAVAVERPT